MQEEAPRYEEFYHVSSPNVHGELISELATRWKFQDDEIKESTKIAIENLKIKKQKEIDIISQHYESEANKIYEQEKIRLHELETTRRNQIETILKPSWISRWFF